jgi:Fe2+ or Zn2+ uptake regulation protein
VCSDKEFVEAVLGADSWNYKQVLARAREFKEMSEATVNRYLTRLKQAGMICHSGGLYWAAHAERTR